MQISSENLSNYSFCREINEQARINLIKLINSKWKKFVYNKNLKIRTIFNIINKKKKEEVNLAK